MLVLTLLVLSANPWKMKSQNSEWETLIPADVIEISAFRSAGFVKLHWRSSVGRGLPMYPSSRMTGEDARFFQNPGNMGREGREG